VSSLFTLRGFASDQRSSRRCPPRPDSLDGFAPSHLARGALNAALESTATFKDFCSLSGVRLMRLCRVQYQGSSHAAFYDEERVVPLAAVREAFNRQAGPKLDLPAGDDLLDFLPHGAGFAAARRLADFLAAQPSAVPAGATIGAKGAELLVPI